MGPLIENRILMTCMRAKLFDKSSRGPHSDCTPLEADRKIAQAPPNVGGARREWRGHRGGAPRADAQ